MRKFGKYKTILTQCFHGIILVILQLIFRGLEKRNCGAFRATDPARNNLKMRISIEIYRD